MLAVVVFAWATCPFFLVFADAQVEKIPPKDQQKTGLSSSGKKTVKNSEMIPTRNSERWIGPYLDQASQDNNTSKIPSESQIPTDFVPWWDQTIQTPARKEQGSIGVDWLVQSALQHSPFVKAIRAEPQIRQSQLCEEAAAFDWTAFLETSYDNLNDPIGNTLTTGNNESRFIDQQWSAKGGVRRRNPLGGEVEIGQRFGKQRNNSIFLDPNPQGTSRLELNYTQPLLNGGGRVYNRSRIVIARLGQVASSAAARERLQDHLLKVTEAYWRLYQAKARNQQRRKLLGEAISISESIDDRRKLDTQYGQVLRARSAVAKRRSELARIETDIRNAEAELRLLVNDPVLVQMKSSHYILADAPSYRLIPVSMSDSITTALQYRPDISQAIQKVSTASVRLGVAKNELLPRLDFVMGTYLSGLAARGESLNAWGRQFSEGGPGFSVGLQFEIPIGNRAAKARQRQRQFEFVKAQSEFEGSVQTALNEVELAVREVRTSHRELTGKFQAMTAAQKETDYLTDRFKTLPGDDVSANLMLEQLLESQERLADEEFAFVSAQVNYSVSLVNLRRAMGTLLMFDGSSTKEERAPGKVDIPQALPKVVPTALNTALAGDDKAGKNVAQKPNAKIVQCAATGSGPVKKAVSSEDTGLKAQSQQLRKNPEKQPISTGIQLSGRQPKQSFESRLWSTYKQAPPPKNSLWPKVSNRTRRLSNDRR